MSARGTTGPLPFRTTPRAVVISSELFPFSLRGSVTIAYGSKATIEIKTLSLDNTPHSTAEWVRFLREIASAVERDAGLP